MKRLILSVGTVLVLNHFVVQVGFAHGHSMEPGLLIGDIVLVDKLSSDIDRFELIVLRHPFEPSVHFVKRVIGLPGDTLEYNKKNVFKINGKILNEDYFGEPSNEEFPQNQDEWVKIIIPEGEYFVMGDNRHHSGDSREFGFVGKSLIKGKIPVRIWPPGRAKVF